MAQTSLFATEPPHAPLPPEMVPTATTTATISADGLYRYRLGRRWSAGSTMLFVMLNPSSADAHEDDPTIRRCIRFAKREGCGALDVVNLFALRATDPKDLVRLGFDPIGPENDAAIVEAAAKASILVAAWGGGVPRAHRQRPADVQRLLATYPLKALRLAKDGAPWHPLYLPGDVPLLPFGART